MKKIILSSTLVLAFAAVTTVGVNAATETDKTENLTANVKLNAVKPEDALKITKAGHLQFGEGTIGIKTLYLNTENKTAQGDKKPQLEVTDLRGTAVGWRLNAEISDFKSGENGPTLKGVELFFPQVANWTTGNETIPDGTTPTTVGVDKMTPETTELKGVSIKPGVENKKTILNAGENQGSGRWNVEYSTVGEKKNLPIYLKIPSGNQVGSYTASLTYSLEDAPIGK